MPRSSRRPLGARWAVGVQRRPWLALGGGLALLVLLALPFLGVRYGFPDAGNDRAGTTTRQAYDLLADGFGPGFNGPLTAVVYAPEVPKDKQKELAQGVADEIKTFPGVAAVSEPAQNEAGDITVVSATADRKSTRLNSSHLDVSRMPSSA